MRLDALDAPHLDVRLGYRMFERGGHQYLVYPVGTPLLVAPLVGRALIVAAFLNTPYIRAGGLGEALAGHHDRHACLASLGVTLLAILTLCGPAAAGTILLLAGGFLLYWRHAALRHLGGFTGDLAGALVERGEALTLLACVVVLAGR